MAVRSVARATGMICAAALLLSAVGAGLTGAVARAATCSGTSTWTGGGDGHKWTDPLNWTPGVPGPDASVQISGGTFTLDGIIGTVCGLTVAGPVAVPLPALPPSPTTLSGDLTTTGDATVSGFTSFTGTLDAKQTLSLPDAADLALGDASLVTVDGLGTLGAGALVHGPTSPTVVPSFAVPGALTLTGAAAFTGVALQLQPRQNGAGTLELGGRTLTLTGPSVSVLGAGTALTSATTNGALVASTGAQVVPAGVTVQQRASLRLQAGSTLGQDGPNLTLTGPGILNWQAGALKGNLTLSLPTVMDGGGTRLVPTTSTLTNANQLSVLDGVLDLRGTLDNGSTVHLYPGSTASGTGSSPALLVNRPGATVTVEPVVAGGSAVLDGVSLRNSGTVSVPPKEKLILGSSGAAVASDLLDGGKILATAPPAAVGDAPGTLQISAGETVRLTGTTTITKATVRLDDPVGDGSTARLVAGAAIAKLTALTEGDGFFSWRSGTLAGAVTLDKLVTDVTSSHASGTRVLAGLDAAHPGLLTLGGTVTVNPTTILLAAKSRVSITGTTTLASSPGGFDITGAADGQRVTVAAGGTLRHIAQSTTTERSSNSTSPMTFAVPLFNNGTVSLETSLNVQAGYTQDVAASAPSTAAAPVTGLFNTSVLSAVNDNVVGPITLTRGGLGGTGTVKANPLTMGTGFLHPGTASNSGTMTLQGRTVLAAGTDTQIVLRSTTDHDKLVIAPLTAGTTTIPGTIALAGRLTGFSSSYNPAYGTTVSSVITYPAHTGAFTSGSSSGLSSGFGWRPAYPGAGKSVDLRVVDVAAPAIGIAGNPAFTQFTSQRFTYSAVDNKTGVRSFDVRWQQATTNQAYGAWAYPVGWQNTTATSQNLTGLVKGRTYCFSVRARDVAGNVSAWSRSLCTAKMLDDRAAVASTGWSRPYGLRGWYEGSYSRSSTFGATLKVAGAFTRVALTGQTCRGCGAIRVYVGLTLVSTVNFNAATTGMKSWVSPVLSLRTATVTLRVITGGHPVTLDAIGLAR